MEPAIARCQRRTSVRCISRSGWFTFNYSGHGPKRRTCDDCQAANKHRRKSVRADGYGYEHRRISARLHAELARDGGGYGWPCPFCKLPMWPGQRLQLDHRCALALQRGEPSPGDRLAHQKCNSRAGQALGQQIKRARAQRFGDVPDEQGSPSHYHSAQELRRTLDLYPAQQAPVGESGGAPAQGGVITQGASVRAPQSPGEGGDGLPYLTDLPTLVPNPADAVEVGTHEGGVRRYATHRARTTVRGVRARGTAGTSTRCVLPSRHGRGTSRQ